MPTGATAHSNPTWARDELILALDLYFQHPPTSIGKAHPAVIELSEVLNSLPIHGDTKGFVKFRNPNGVYMKMCNFLRFDESYTGKGLSKGSQGEEAVWKEFASDRGRLRMVANAIRAGLTSPDAAKESLGAEEEDEGFPEGKVLARLHRARELSAAIREKAKAAALKSGRGLVCTACGFDFGRRYGETGAGYIECHCTRPVSELGDRTPVRLDDVALLCSNCHRMAHRRRPWLTLENLGTLIA
jgi:5-methylcytosine-specific restriction protein A